MSFLVQLIEDLTLMNDHCLPVAFFFFPTDRLVVLRDILLCLHAYTHRFLAFLFGLVFLLIKGGHVFLPCVVQFILMVLHRLNLRVKDELLASDVEASTSLLLRALLEVSAHSHILFFQQLDVLMGRLLIIKQRTDTGVLLIFNDLFLKNSELKLHEVDLLLEDLEVVLLWANVWILAQTVNSILVLTSKLHRVR